MAHRGRGAGSNPPNRFHTLYLEPITPEYQEIEDERPLKTIFYKDTSKSILARNDSPDIPFSFSLNPYRGCEHGCIYCYARPSHEYLGFSAGLDFESRIMVKEDAPALLDAALSRKSWNGEMICFSGNTDCYQPVERALKLTRRCLEIVLKHRNPVGVITKNHLVTRDIDILKPLADLKLVIVTLSIATLNPLLARRLEPRASDPAKRLEALRTLAGENIPVHVNISPVIPGLTDEEIPSILDAAAAHGVRSASHTLIRLPGAVEELFLEWLRRTMPHRAEKILHRIRETRSGKLNDTRWGKRMSGEGQIARSIHQIFSLHCRKIGFNQGEFSFAKGTFIRKPAGHQTEMFPL